MVMLIRKMFRDVWKNKVPFIAIFLMMFTGNFIFSGITCEYNGMNESFHSFLDETNLADAWIMSKSFDDSKIDEFQKKSNINDIECRTLLSATLQNNANKSIDLYLLDGTNDISKMKIISGEKYNSSKEGIWLDITFAENNGYKINDTIKLSVDGQILENKIIGLCYSPEYIYNTKDGELIPDHDNTGFAFLNKEFVENKDDIPFNQILVVGEGNLEESINDSFGTEGITVILQNDHLSYSMLNDEIKQHKEIGLIFVAVFLFIAILITITTVHRMLSSQRIQIGILKALGFRKRKLFLHYVSHSTFVCFCGALLGWILGFAILPNLIYPIMEEIYILPSLEPSMIELSWTLPIACALLCFLISIIICRKYLNGNAAKILYSNGVEKIYRELPLYSIRKHLSFYAQWNIRDIFRNKLRSVMTILGVVGCVSLLFSSLGLYTSMRNMSDWTFDKVQTYETKINGDFQDEKYKNELIEDVFGEELMETTVELKFDDQKKSVSFTGIESQDYIRLYNTENKKIDLEDGIAISRNIANELNIHINDRVRWRFSGSKTWYMSIVKEIIRTPMSQGITMMRSDMEKENIPFHATSIVGEEIENVDIDSNYVSSVQNKSDLKSSMQTMLNASIMLSALFLIMAVLLGSVILYNLGTLSYIERYRDMATLKVLGFDRKRINKLMIQQNLWLTIVGILIGLPAGFGLLVIMVGTVQSSIDMIVYTPAYIYVFCILGTYMLSLLINKILANKLKHIDMVSALKINE